MNNGVLKAGEGPTVWVVGDRDTIKAEEFIRARPDLWDEVTGE